MRDILAGDPEGKKGGQATEGEREKDKGERISLSGMCSRPVPGDCRVASGSSQCPAIADIASEAKQSHCSMGQWTPAPREVTSFAGMTMRRASARAYSRSDLMVFRYSSLSTGFSKIAFGSGTARCLPAMPLTTTMGMSLSESFFLIFR
jgi:hypothetical protein